MKGIKIFACAYLAASSMASCGGNSSQAQEPELTPAQQLHARLDSISKAGCFAFGHHDDTAYGHTWKFEDNRSDVKEICGDYPGVMNWDLGLIEYNNDKELDGVPFEFIRNEVAKQHARGGINTFSWHVRNPGNNEDSWNCEAPNVVTQCLTPGNALNDTLRVWCERAADFIGSLRDENGDRIGVVFRPWHEHTGEWFWWGINHCTPQEYIALWQFTYKIFEEKGIDNVLWAYSPDKSNVDGIDTYMERYPGDEYVDIMGADIYHYGGAEGKDHFEKLIHTVLAAATEAAKSHNKLLAFTETGSEGVPMENWWHEVLLENAAKYPISYVCVWRNAWDKPTHFYGPFKGHPSEESFLKFYNDKRTLFAKEMKNF